MQIFVSGGTGYMGQRLIRLLLDRGHAVTAIVRSCSASKLPPGAASVSGNVLDADSFSARIPPADTFVHLVGTSRPAPWKEKEFRAVDLASVRACVNACRNSTISHFVYVSVAQPAPVMRTYIQARSECEALINEAGLNATILRPWYVLGPGHRWPILLKPLYALFEHLPGTRDTATRLGLVTIGQMVRALAWAVENPVKGRRIISVPEIRSAGLHRASDGGAVDRATAAR